MVYKLVADLDSLDLNLLFDYLEKKGIDVCLDGEDIYLHKQYNNQTSIDKIMKKMKMFNYFLKKITDKPSDSANGFIYKWIYEKMSADEVAAFEEAHQAELREMMNNIDKARELLRAQQEKLKEETDGDKGDTLG